MVGLFLSLALVLSLFAQESGIRLTPAISGISSPTDIQHAGDGSNRLFLVEQTGIIRISRNGALNQQPFLDIRNRVRNSGEQGLLGLAFSPSFASSGRFYVNYVSTAGSTIISMFTVTANLDVANANSETILLTVAQPFTNHKGGQLRFSPDGFLYVALGDGGSAGDPQGHAQNLQSLLGKILRIDVESQPGTVRIPPGNPFGGANARTEIWSYGLRNPWRFSFDRSTGDVWIADVGQNAWEEINFQAASSGGGQNYGWNITEGAHCYNAQTCNTQGLVLPVAEYANGGQDCSVTGGLVYRGSATPLQGTYFYGDFCSGRIWGIRRTTGQFSNQLQLDSDLLITTFGEDEAGELYVADGRLGTIYRIESSSSVSLTLQSSPTGQRFTFDQQPNPMTAPVTLSVEAGMDHTITWLNTGNGSARTVFTGWSDGNNSNPRSINPGQSSATYTGNFATQVRLTQNTSAGGSVALSPASDGWYVAGSTVQATATANAGFRFSGFSGCASSASTSVSFAINNPCTLNAQFTPESTAMTGLRFVTVVPCRVLDTRESGPAGFGAPILSAGVRRDVAMTQSQCAIPADAKAYSLNVTVVPGGPLGFLTLWPRGITQPVVSTLNSSDGRVVANAAIVPAGTGGDISVLVTDATHAILDINGYFVETAPNGSAFFPAIPCRPVDTRGESGQTGALGPPILSGGAPRDFPITQGPCALPTSAVAYSLNATVVPEGGLAYLTLWPSASPQPLVSTLNSFDGRVVANAAVVAAGTAKSVTAFASSRTHLILDTNGYFAPPASSIGALLFYPVVPCRIADTRTAGGKSGPFGPPSLSAGTQRAIPIPLSSCGIPSSARAYSLNVTVVPHAPLDYLTLWPTGQPRPYVSTLNSFQGMIVANAALAPAGANGSVSVFVTHAADVVIDINGYFAP